MKRMYTIGKADNSLDTLYSIKMPVTNEVLLARIGHFKDKGKWRVCSLKNGITECHDQFALLEIAP